MKIFNLDSPFMQFLSKMTDLLLLNLLTGICCIPIVTIGASLTALNYVTLKMARNEDCYIFKSYFKSFKENFKQATIIWLLMLLVAVVVGVDFMIMNRAGESSNKVMRVLITIVGVIWVFTATFVFPVLAKFDNTVFKTIKNAFVISVLQFPKTILMIIINVIPWIIMLASIRMAPLSMFFGLSLSALANAFLYKKFFKKLEDQIQEANGINPPAEEPEDKNEDERIFHDELDEGISLDSNRYHE